MNGRALYNEIDGFCCATLSNLMDAGLITPGKIDDRSIHDLAPDDVAGFRRVHLFAGLAGWEIALELAGWGDRGCWTGSCPCQPFSAAGRQRGFEDERDLWPEVRRLVAGARPPVLLGEQSPQSSRWIARTRSDLEGLGYDFAGLPLKASDVGAPHARRRFWFVADSEWNKQPREEPRRRAVGRVGRQFQSIPWDRTCERALREFRALDDGLSYGVAATDAARNAIVPQAGAAFISAYLDGKRDRSRMISPTQTEPT